MDETEDAGKGFHVDKYLHEFDVGSLRDLIVDGGNEGDEGEGQSSDCTDPASQTDVLEEDQEVDEAQDIEWEEDGDEVGAGIFVHRNPEVHILEVLDLMIVLFLLFIVGELH